MLRCVLRRKLLAAVLSLLLSGTVAAAVAQPEIKGDFVDTVDVRLVEVDVVVTDRNGQPVQGLSKEDFELYENEKQVEITNFSEFASVLEMQGDPSGGQGAADSTGAEQRTSSAPSQQLTIVLYLDGPNLYGPHRARLLRRLEAASAAWRSWNARFMLAAYRKRLEVVVPPTTDLDLVLAEATKRRKGMTQGMTRQLARRRAITEIQSFDPDCRANALSLARNYAAQEANRVAVAVDGLIDLVATLASVPGKKAVVYLGSSLPQHPGMEMFAYLAEQQCPQRASRFLSEQFSHDESKRLGRLASHANANRVTFYAVDAAGLGGGLAFDISLDSGPLGSSSFMENDRVHRLNAQSGMLAISRDTGGKLLTNSNDLAELLADASEHLLAGYSLGFMPEKRRPGKVKRLDVVLAPHAAQGRRVAFRKSYRDKGLQERLAERLVAVTYLGDIDNPLSVKMNFDAPRKLRRKRFEIAVNLVVPEESITILPGPRGRRGTGKLRLWMLAAETEKSGRTTAREKLVSIGRGGEEPEAGVWWFNISMRLDRGDYDIAVGVRDETSGVASMLRMPIEVKESAGNENRGERPKRRRRSLSIQERPLGGSLGSDM